MNQGVDNILRVFDRADEIDRNEGRRAYIRYKAVCARISSEYGYTLGEVAAVVAALSPNCDYVKNLRSALSVVAAHKAGRPAHVVRVASYNHCRDRAIKYLDGVDFLGTVEGKKTRAFYQNIMKTKSEMLADAEAVAEQKKSKPKTKAAAFREATAAAEILIGGEVKFLFVFNPKVANFALNIEASGFRDAKRLLPDLFDMKKGTYGATVYFPFR